MTTRYRDAVAKLQQNVQKHLKELKEFSSSDDDEPYDSNVLDSVFRSYKRDGGDIYMLDRTQHLLEEAISGRAITCLICIGSIKRVDPIWTCDYCYCNLHLSCIQKWANDSISLKNEEIHSSLPILISRKIEWCCPKCRKSYNKHDIPQQYRCYCGKSVDPQYHPWLIPHTCGEVCEKYLSNRDNCKHKCLLLCHPGPCPPCPQTVNSTCFCGQEQKRVRCSAATWSCGQQCKRTLLCNSHKCESICHPGECSLCKYVSIQPCKCGSEEAERPCNNPSWQCDKVCNKLFSCGYHMCERQCHSAGCGICPNSGLQSCPCGAEKKFVQCPDVIKTCLGTCGKRHKNCEHNCPEKCHKGACPPCQVLTEKKCLCSTHSRMLPCSKEFKCETKCRGIRLCGKHACGRKCCNGNCPPCEKVCDKPLQCGRHKCTMICHRGPCYPCSRESKVTCRCKESFISVLCGRERFIKPPKCIKLCKLKYKCGHVNENSHVCHFGACPPCKTICNKPFLNCEHRCRLVCHENVAVVFKQVEKPATPWEITPPITKIMSLECPPCEVPVPIVCFGEHETVNQACSVARRHCCGRTCSQPLLCGNHKCSLLCHLYTEDSLYPNVPYNCNQCELDCNKIRPDKCYHKCALQVCHPGPCPPCEILEYISCHCGLTKLYLRCREISTATDEMLSCKLQCPRNLSCGHRCKSTCHAGMCGVNQICHKETKIYCPCTNLRKKAACNLVMSGDIAVACDSSCEAKKLAIQLEKEREERRVRELNEEKNRKELAEYEWKLSGKKKKNKERKIVKTVNNKSALQKYWGAILSIVIILTAVAYMLIEY